MVTKSYIIGLPASGKTTFLGALGYSLLSNTVEENVYEIDSIDNLDYIKSLANTWSQCKEMIIINWSYIFRISPEKNLSI